MKFKILSILLIALTLTLTLEAQKIRVGLFYDHLLNSFTFHCTSGNYIFISGSDTLLESGPGEIFFIEQTSGQITLRDGDTYYGTFPILRIKESVYESTCRLKAVQPVLNPESYTGNFNVNIVHGTIQIINELELDKYLAGVVEAESGPVAEDEFYKAQSVICRTYALKNWDRHISEGFNLCDETHCQVFHGISDENPDIVHAVLSTHKIVVTDQYSRLVDPVFHSNSGGETQRASDIWPTDHDYLQAIVDPFSKDQRNSKWQEQITMEEWLSYLKSKGFSLKKTEPSATLIEQPHRRKYLIVAKDTLSLSVIRQDMGLKSSFFDMVPQGDTIIFRGRGYGHGIGLSQEGAMEMAKEGFSYSDILQFYYNQVKILNIDELPRAELPVEFR